MSEIVSKIWSRLINIKRSEASYKPKKTEITRLVPVSIKDGRLFNREISDLLFIERVMEESTNRDHPLLERVRFLTIAADVLDQFYAVRVAKLRRSAAKKDGYVTPDGMTSAQQLLAVSHKGDGMLQALQSDWAKLKVELTNNNIVFPEADDLSTDDMNWMLGNFRTHFLHVLTPFTIDEEHPFPFIPSGGLCAVLEMRDGNILLPLPANLYRFVSIPGKSHRFVSAELMIKLFWREIIPGDDILGFGVFQILRDNDLAHQERGNDLRGMVESGLKMRHKANVIKLNVSDEMSEAATQFVAEQLGLYTHQKIKGFEHRNQSIQTSEYITAAPLVGLNNVSEILDLLSSRFPEFLFPAFKARYPAQMNQFGNDCFAAIKHSDIAVHWPYESFDSVIKFLDQASIDPKVISIKQTLYRTNDKSPIVEALITAAAHGKAVLAVIELEARDNEQSNIIIAKKMEAAGVQIIYGIIGLKIHCKATLIVRMEDDEAITYTHLGTGNYHPRNAKTYTDISFFTRNQTIGNDTHLVFNYLSSGKVREPEMLIVAPYFLRKRLLALIDQEVNNAKAGLPAHICIKVNSLTDKEIVERLYVASEAGVEVDLIIRRHCTLRPGVPGMSSRIRVKSIVGRFLEHARIYLFAGGKGLSSESAHVYFGSADLMERNLDERAEILVPVEDMAIRSMLVDGIMHANIIDTQQSWYLNGDNEYHRAESEGDGFNAQSFLMAEQIPATLGNFPKDRLEVKLEKI
ncbi:MAG: polyphosphate kinase [Candidatus Azotimanducaceae bacterium]|jgi:polyphosphate kinase